MNITFLQVDDNETPKTWQEHRADLLEQYKAEDNRGRTFELAAKLKVLQGEVWNALELAHENGQRDLLRRLKALRTDIRDDLSWPIVRDADFKYSIGETFERALDDHRSYEGCEVMRKFIEQLQELSGYHLE
jgi:hypothetical protein